MNVVYRKAPLFDKAVQKGLKARGRNLGRKTFNADDAGRGVRLTPDGFEGGQSFQKLLRLNAKNNPVYGLKTDPGVVNVFHFYQRPAAGVVW